MLCEGIRSIIVKAQDFSYTHAYFFVTIRLRNAKEPAL